MVYKALILGGVTMKKILALTAIAVLLFGFAASMPAKAQTTTTVTNLIEMYVGSATAYVDGSSVKMEAAPLVQSGTVYVPLRFIAENMGDEVLWDDKNREITILEMTASGSEMLVNATVTLKIDSSTGTNITMLPCLGFPTPCSYPRSTATHTFVIKPSVKIVNGRTLVPLGSLATDPLWIASRSFYDKVSSRVVVPGFDPNMQTDQGYGGTITVWYSWEQGSAETAALKKAATEFEKAYKTASVNLVAVDPASLKSKFIATASTGNGPHILIGPSEWIGELADLGLINPIEISHAVDTTNYMLIGPYTSNVPENFAEFVLRANYLDVAINAVSYNGKVYALPESVNTDALYYNKSFVKTLPTSLNDLLTANKKYPVSGGSPLVFDASSFYHESWLHFGLGGGVFSGANYKDVSPIKSLSSVKAFQALADLRKNKVTPSTLPTYQTAANLFSSKKAAFFIGGPEKYAVLKKTLGTNLGLMAIPSGKPMVSVEAVMIAKNVPSNMRTAFEFAKFLTGVTSFGGGFNAEVNMAKTASHIPAALKPYNDSNLLDDPMVKVFSVQATKGTLLPCAPATSAVMSVMSKILPNVYQGKITAQDAANQAYQQITSQIGK